MIHLTPREAAVLCLVAWGASSQEISDRLGVGYGAVKYTAKTLMHRFGVRDRAHLVAVAIRLDILPEDIAIAEGDGEMGSMCSQLLPIGTKVLVTPRNSVRGPEYRAEVVGYNKDRTKYHLGAQIRKDLYAMGGSWAFPDEIATVWDQ